MKAVDDGKRERRGAGQAVLKEKRAGGGGDRPPDEPARKGRVSAGVKSYKQI